MNGVRAKVAFGPWWLSLIARLFGERRYKVNDGIRIDADILRGRAYIRRIRLVGPR